LPPLQRRDRALEAVGQLDGHLVLARSLRHALFPCPTAPAPKRIADGTKTGPYKRFSSRRRLFWRLRRRVGRLRWLRATVTGGCPAARGRCASRPPETSTAATPTATRWSSPSPSWARTS